MPILTLTDALLQLARRVESSLRHDALSHRIQYQYQYQAVNLPAFFSAMRSDILLEDLYLMLINTQLLSQKYRCFCQVQYLDRPSIDFRSHRATELLRRLHTISRRIFDASEAKRHLVENLLCLTLLD